jgi:transposase
MARDTHYDDAQTVRVPLAFEKPLLPGTVAFAIHALSHRCVATAIFASRENNDEGGCSASDPTILLKVVLFAYSRGLMASRKIERACQEHITFRSLACGTGPDHSTSAACIASLKDEMIAIVSDILLGCLEQAVFGGPHLALDGLKLPSNAAKEGSGTCDDWTHKKAPLAAKVRQVVDQHEPADQAGEGSRAEARGSEPEEVHEQITRVEKPAVRRAAGLAAHAPQRGKRGNEPQGHVPENESANMPTAHGVLQGDNGHALGEAKDHVIVPAEAFGNGQDYGPGTPRLDGATDPLKAIGVPEEDWEGKLLRADSPSHSEATLQQGAQDKLDAYLPAPPVRQRDPRVATPARHKAPMAETFTVAACPYDQEHDGYICPQGKGLKLEARRPKIANRSYRRYEAEAADGGGCLLREQCLQPADTQRTHLAVLVETAPEPLAPQRIATIETPAARQIYGVRLAIVEPVVGHIRSQTR